MNLIFKGGLVYQTHRKCFEKMDIIIQDKMIYRTGKDLNGFAGQIIDCQGKYIIPGLIDIHMHIESSMTYPQEFSKMVLPYGITTVVADPHEMANVFGIDGIRAFMDQETILDIYYGIPSSVPATNETIETSGGSIGEEEVRTLLEDDKIICLGEVMNYPDLICEEDTRIKRIIKLCREHKKSIVIEGHCPKLPVEDVQKFIFAGVDSDHTQQTKESIYEKINAGMFIELQKKSLSKENLDVIEENDFYQQIALVTDDTMPDHLMEGQLDDIIRNAVELGMPIEKAIYCATYTPSCRMGLGDRGMIAPGKIGDLVILSDINKFKVEEVYKNGCRYQKGQSETNCTFPEKFYQSIGCRKAEEEDYQLRTNLKTNGMVKANVIQIAPQGTFTKCITREIPVENGIVQWEKTNLSLIVVFERYQKTNAVSYGFIEGGITKQGAVATSWSHDCHNVLVMGTNKKDMTLAQNTIVEKQGGYCVVTNEKEIAFASLRIGGIVSDKPVEQLAQEIKEVRKQIKALGYINTNEIMSISTLTLPVSPEVKITDKGLFYVKTQEKLPLLFVDEKKH